MTNCKRYYFRTRSHGKCGCANWKWWYADGFVSKAALIRAHRHLNIAEVWLPEQLREHYTDKTARRIQGQAIHTAFDEV